MSRQHTVTVYTFTELSDRAKERARDWYRESIADEYDWADAVLSDAATCGDLLGITFQQRQTGTRRDGTPVTEPAILYHGFSSQGDGACFEGTWGPFRMPEDIKAHAPEDTVLHQIADRLNAVQVAYHRTVYANVTHAGPYCHERTVTIDVATEDGQPVAPEHVAEVEDQLRHFMRWIYRQLEQEWEYRNSPDSIDDILADNEYEFYEDGRRVH